MTKILKELNPGDKFFCDIIREVPKYKTVRKKFIVMDTSIYDINFPNDDPDEYQTCIDLTSGAPYSFEKDSEVEIV